MCQNIVSSCVRSKKRDQWTSAVVRRGDVAALKPMLALFPNRSGSRPAGPGPQQGRDLGQRVLSAAGAASRSEPGTCYRQQQQQQRRRRRRGFPAGRSAGMAANGIAKHRFEMFINGMEEAQINRKLPKELLLRIFSYLDVVSLCRCAQVSKFWNVLALDGSNWQKIDLFNFQRDVEGRVVENISKRCGGFLRQLSLRGCQGVGDAALRTFAQNCRNIETLSLNGCTKITDNTCGSLGKFCSKLRHLDLTSCTVITNYSLKALSEGCKNLEHLNVSWCDQVTEDGITALVRECPNLKALLLKGCLQMNDTALRHIGRYCPELSTLNLQNCSRVSDEGLIPVCRGCHKLQSMSVSSCTLLTDALLTALGNNCLRLRILEVAGCSQLSDAGFQVLARNCHELEKMDLEECIQITDSTLLQLSLHCPRLQVLSLSHCELITDEGIQHLGHGACAHDRLHVLELDNCPLVTDRSLEHLQACTSLQRVELYDCQQITRAGIKRLRAHLPDIKIHAYFAPNTPPQANPQPRPRICRCCLIL